MKDNGQVTMKGDLDSLTDREGGSTEYRPWKKLRRPKESNRVRRDGRSDKVSIDFSFPPFPNSGRIRLHLAVSVRSGTRIPVRPGRPQKGI